MDNFLKKSSCGSSSAELKKPAPRSYRHDKTAAVPCEGLYGVLWTRLACSAVCNRLSSTPCSKCGLRTEDGRKIIVRNNRAVLLCHTSLTALKPRSERSACVYL